MKLQERWLETQLERDDLPTELRNAYERELDSIAEMLTRTQEARKAAAKAALESKMARLTEIREKVLKNDRDFILTFGAEEFSHDYEVRQEGTEVVVYSHAAKDFQENRRVHANMELALADLRYLYYNRLYDRYVRSGELDELLELTHE